MIYKLLPRIFRPKERPYSTRFEPAEVIHIPWYRFSPGLVVWKPNDEAPSGLSNIYDGEFTRQVHIWRVVAGFDGRAQHWWLNHEA